LLEVLYLINYFKNNVNKKQRMKKFYSLLFLCCASFMGFAQTSTYSSAGAYVYTVPPGVTSLGVDVRGAQGGTYAGGTGGKGGQILATLAVTGGQVLYVFVGGAGGNGNGSAGGTSAGGEAGGVGGNGGGGSGGGAASDIRTSTAGGATSGVSLSSRLVVGGGGGGGNWSCSSQWPGGTGGYPAGAGGTGSCTGGTTGGSQTTGGYGLVYYSLCGCSGTSGSFGAGGSGNFWGGGGGGGWYGGGGGSETSGGGGSSYYGGAGVSGATPNNGFQSGAGQVTITVLCSAPGTVTGSLAVCVGATTTLTASASAGTWSSSDNTKATVTSGGVVTGVAAGTANITYNIGSPCGGVSAFATVTVNALPVVTGTQNVCTGLTTALTPAPAGGTWTSSDNTMATVDPTGTVTGVGVGVPNITYVRPVTGCRSVTPVTVNLQPAAIGGPGSVCTGQSVSLTETTAGGAWSSTVPGVASVSGTGSVLGVSSGSAFINYTMPSGCASTVPMAVNPLPALIGGPSAGCTGQTTDLTDATSGGTWSSTNAAVASVLGGVVSGLTAGSTNIVYTLPGGC